MSGESIFSGGKGKVRTQGIREVVTAPTTRLGDRISFHDGREFAYAKIAKGGAPYVATAFSSNAMNKAGFLMCTRPDVTARYTNMPVSETAAIGQKFVKIANSGDTSMVADEFKDGWLWVNDATGAGYNYRIKGHLSANTTNTSVTIYLYDGLEVALVTTSEVCIMPNKYYDVRGRSDSAASGVAVGVMVISVASTDASYCWLQTKGPCAVLQNGTASAGQAMIEGSPSGTMAPMLTATDTQVWRPLGYCMRTAASTEHVLVDLDII